MDGLDNLQTVDEHLLRTGQRYFVVEEKGRIAGIITPHEVKAVPRARWPYTTVDEVMQPLDRLHTVKPDTSVTEALETMGREEVKVVVAPQWIERVSWEESKVHVDLTRESIKGAPEFDATALVNREYEHSL